MDTRFSKFRAAATVASLALALGLLAGCSSGDSGTPASVTRTFVGQAEGTAALVGVVVDGTRVLAYACDGVPGDPVGTQPSVQVWWNGASDGRTVDVQQPAGRLRLQLTDAGMSGTLTLADGRTLKVSGKVAGADAGLYRADAMSMDTRAVAGWIVAADGQQRGGVGTESGGTIKLSGARVLTLSQPTITLQGLATARIAKVGITPIPIP